MSADLSDLILWEAVKNDDLQAFDLLFNRHWSKIYSTAFNRLRDREACIEITNDIFVMLWTKRDRLNIQSFQSYLQASARYHVYRYIKLARTAPFEYNYDIENLSSKNYAVNADYNLQYAELERSVDYYLSQLPRKCREIFILSRKGNLSNDEIANQLSISKRTVENQITNALKHLRFSLKKLFVILCLLVYALL